jgi:poly(glycerol-phosphate) alpha-glucosyltransferase
LFDAERRIQQSVVNLADDITTTVVGVHDVHSNEDAKKWLPIHARSVVPARFPPRLAWSRKYESLLDETSPDLVYCIGLWKYYSRSCWKWCLANDRPYVVAPHGMLDPWALNASRSKKRLLLKWYQHGHLRDASCIRALNQAEADSIRDLGYQNPIAIIPNSIDIVDTSNAEQSGNTVGDSKTLLFLARLHPKKGLSELLAAWAKLGEKRNGWRLEIAGWGDESYVEELNLQIQNLRLAESVTMLGPLFNQDKSDAFQRAGGFILPSFSEGMPMTILEAWSYGLPVIMTDACNIPSGPEAGASLVCEPNVDSIASEIIRLIELPSDSRQQMGQRGKALVQKQFTWDRVGQSLTQLYRWLIDDDDRPNFVV